MWDEEDKVIKVMIKLMRPVKPDESVRRALCHSQAYTNVKHCR